MHRTGWCACTCMSLYVSDLELLAMPGHATGLAWTRDWFSRLALLVWPWHDHPCPLVWTRWWGAAPWTCLEYPNFVILELYVHCHATYCNPYAYIILYILYSCCHCGSCYWHPWCRCRRLWHSCCCCCCCCRCRCCCSAPSKNARTKELVEKLVVFFTQPDVSGMFMDLFVLALCIHHGPPNYPHRKYSHQK